ncbi:uncharacterized protein N7496_003582 [Penicillium cataractarum]|uniref:Zn(2)-C6 fungal-type domain-containing protein n=1 Tax=Penicillium cataractarum TaxID=2100454 RepID=A0A9W9SPM7_9EURO|nr:uncharacterized protein N7496_003582 [Penicillium cataractarum]KAJ5381154.1 hypothetical protein N7496_003582 [Penicillium cataractarum]
MRGPQRPQHKINNNSHVLTPVYQVAKKQCLRPGIAWESPGGLAKWACKECHRRKIKCNMTTKSKCTSCTKLNVPCSVNEYRRRRNNESPPSHFAEVTRRSKIAQLESQIERMEQVFEELGLVPPSDDLSLHATPYAQSNGPEAISAFQAQDTSTSTRVGINESDLEKSNLGLGGTLISRDEFAVSNPVSPTSIGENNSFLKNLVFPRCTEFGGNDSRSVSPDSCNCHHRSVRAALGDRFIEGKTTLLSCEVPCHYEELHTLDGSTTRRSPSPLPTMAEIMVLFLQYLENFNSLCPLFEPLSLLSICDGDCEILSTQPDRWACINVVLALAYMMRDEPPGGTHKNSEAAWAFMENSLLVVNELCLGEETLWAAQALLGMAIFFLGALSYRPCNRMIASALRISHRLVIEHPEDSSTDGQRDLQQLRTVFWIAFCLDREICLRFGGPLGYCDEDMDIDFLPGPLGDGWNLSSATQKTGFNIFKSYCELSVIKGNIYQRLHCGTAHPISELADSVAMLDKRLQEWKESVPKEYRPDVHNAPSFPKSTGTLVLLSLHFSYFNCLISVHRVTTFRDSNLDLELARSYSSGLLPSDVALISGILCQNAARASIRLIKYMPQRYACILGFLLHYLIIASTTLSTSIIHNPRLASRAWDLKLIHQVECFMSSIALASPKDGLQRLVKHCAEYRALAESAVCCGDATSNNVQNTHLT